MVSNIFYFHPYLGKWSNLTNIFQLGWNHQLEEFNIVKRLSLFFIVFHDITFWYILSILVSSRVGYGLVEWPCFLPATWRIMCHFIAECFSFGLKYQVVVRFVEWGPIEIGMMGVFKLWCVLWIEGQLKLGWWVTWVTNWGPKRKSHWRSFQDELVVTNYFIEGPN